VGLRARVGVRVGARVKVRVRVRVRVERRRKEGPEKAYITLLATLIQRKPG
jgi:hypothetical protein